MHRVLHLFVLGLKVALSLADWSPISGQHLGDRDFSIALAEQYYEEITHELHHIKS